MSVPATTAEIAGIRRRYLRMALSVFLLDFAITLIFTAAAGSWVNLWRSAGVGVLLLLGVNWLVARWLFEPIRRFLEGEIPFEDIQRRLTQLPLLTARTVGGLGLAVSVFRLSTPWWVDPATVLLPKPTTHSGSSPTRRRHRSLTPPRNSRCKTSRSTVELKD